MDQYGWVSKIMDDPNCQLQQLSGGDINSVVKAVTSNNTSVFKINDKARFPGMFEIEMDGLELLRSSETFRIPEVKKQDVHGSYQFLQLEFISSGNPTEGFWTDFALKLNQLHQHSTNYFGLNKRNYIGSLQQFNQPATSWTNFIINERFIPQIRMATDAGILSNSEVKKIEAIYKHCDELWPKEPPALLHGDLWSGNFMVSSKNEPVLIDPAVYYGHREMDIGMMHLFGGFEPEIFDVYNTLRPLEKGWEQRIKYNQLYPLLVHLNLFGLSYWESINSIVKPFN